ncbi:integrase [Pseudomonas sp. FW305-70]|nr:integrase [Pseudomonas sp. FW305-70]
MHRVNDSAWKKARVRAANLWREENLRPAMASDLAQLRRKSV